MMKRAMLLAVFPPDAKLIVSGKRILAVTKARKAIYVNEIMPPQTKSE